MDSQSSQSSTVPAVRGRNAPYRCAPHESAWVLAEHESARGTDHAEGLAPRRLFEPLFQRGVSEGRLCDMGSSEGIRSIVRRRSRETEQERRRTTDRERRRAKRAARRASHRDGS